MSPLAIGRWQQFGFGFCGDWFSFYAVMGGVFHGYWQIESVWFLIFPFTYRELLLNLFVVGLGFHFSLAVVAEFVCGWVGFSRFTCC
ncbi:hypothetical protein Patl1_25766 [Pistacia atlantica]|uniref:Uncharacterized protein n=1 Tax=Pistacia atlantica TaxID=434234 RepID=A0ACC1B348_9ROSI|nr:hypothetical protein Patl1_25766 [Pistacia atlantica]